MGKYEEAVYKRAEKQFKNIKDAQDWLLSFENQSRKNSFAKEAYNLGKDVGNFNEINSRVDESTEYSELNDLKKLAEGIENRDLREEILPIINTKMDKVGEELEKLKEERKEKRLDDEAEQIRIANIEKRVLDIENDISGVEDINDVKRITKRIDNLDDEADVSSLRAELNKIENDILEKKAIASEEKRLAKVFAREQIKRTGEGISPDF